MHLGNSWRSAAADLAVGADCAGCGTPGLGWCRACAVACRPVPRLVAGVADVPVLAVLDNVGPAARVVVAWKDRGRLGLTDPLGRLLAVGCSLVPPAARPALVPVPTSRAQVRRRGADPMRLLAARAATELRSVGIDAVPMPVLRRVRATRDQAGLGARARGVNVEGAFAADRSVVARCVRAGIDEVLVVDDVLTTGASVREAVRALAAAGVRTSAVVVVAHTPRPGAAPT
ncbi:ComF family protein [Aeromicrobium sp. Sec7.5]|uniref:ComF family protein n=1 Tax=Aeromicrobium sp. Sec7.5 TaxID=3121276 RepID=UPI002FE47082